MATFFQVSVNNTNINIKINMIAADGMRELPVDRNNFRLPDIADCRILFLEHDNVIAYVSISISISISLQHDCRRWDAGTPRVSEQFPVARHCRLQDSFLKT